MTDDELRHLCKIAIIGDAFAELARRQDMLPSFRVPAEKPQGTHRTGEP